MANAEHCQVLCDHCGKLISKACIARHKKFCQPHLAAGPQIVYICDSPCLKTFVRADHLKQHQKGSSCSLKAKICPHCDAAVKGSMKTHIERKCHAKYLCEDCGQAYKKKNELLEHKKSHTNCLAMITPSGNTV